MNILCALGLPAIDQAVDEILQAMLDFPAELGDALSLAKIVGCLIALGVGSYECWMMMLGRRGMDVMKILRIIILSFCITSSSALAEALQFPGIKLEEMMKEKVMAKAAEIDALQQQVSQASSNFGDHMAAIQDSVDYAQKIADDPSWWETVSSIYTEINPLAKTLMNLHKRALTALWTTVGEIINEVARFIGETVFQISYMGIMIAQRAIMALMICFLPLAFALSLAPPWHSAWSQWISKFLSITLWGFVAYTFMFYTESMLVYGLQSDIEAYMRLSASFDNSYLGSMLDIGYQVIGSTCKFVVGLFIGSWLIKMTPEVASWLIPGGVSSSGASSMAGNMVNGAAATAAAPLLPLKMIR